MGIKDKQNIRSGGKFLLLFVSFVIFSFSLNRFSLRGKDALKLNARELFNSSSIQKEKLNNIKSHIDSLVNLYNTEYQFSGSILIGYNNQKIYKNNIGYANPKKRTPLEPNTPFQLASVSKQFTASAILLLRKKQKLSLDNRVTRHLPKFPYPRITVRQLLHHTSGLPNYMWVNENYWRIDSCAPYNDDVIALLANKTPNLYFIPGTRFSYSNTGYVVLASLVEKISGKPFGTFLQENIFRPLEMNHTFVSSTTFPRGHAPFLDGYRKSRWSYRLIPHTVNDGTVGDKNVYSTAEDLFKWKKALISTELFSRDELNEIFSKGKVRNGNKIDYGLGFRIKSTDDPAHKIIYHNGLWNGFRTSFIWHKNENFTIIVLNHTDSKLKNDLVKELEQILCTSEEKVIS